MPKHILLVEDNTDHQFILSTHLEAAHYRVHTADNGLKALKVLGKEKIDLIIVDLWMPQLDGFTLLHSLKTHPEWAAIPVIVTTGLEKPKDVLDLAGLEIGQYFTKPYEPSDVLAAVEHLLV